MSFEPCTALRCAATSLSHLWPENRAPHPFSSIAIDRRRRDYLRTLPNVWPQTRSYLITPTIPNSPSRSPHHPGTAGRSPHTRRSTTIVYLLCLVFHRPPTEHSCKTSVDTAWYVQRAHTYLIPLSLFPSYCPQSA